MARIRSNSTLLAASALLGLTLLAPPAPACSLRGHYPWWDRPAVSGMTVPTPAASTLLPPLSPVPGALPQGTLAAPPGWKNPIGFAPPWTWNLSPLPSTPPLTTTPNPPGHPATPTPPSPAPIPEPTALALLLVASAAYGLRRRWG
jgi:hypothetical protein